MDQGSRYSIDALWIPDSKNGTLNWLPQYHWVSPHFHTENVIEVSLYSRILTHLKETHWIQEHVNCGCPLNFRGMLCFTGWETTRSHGWVAEPEGHAWGQICPVVHVDEHTTSVSVFELNWHSLCLKHSNKQNDMWIKVHPHLCFKYILSYPVVLHENYKRIN